MSLGIPDKWTEVTVGDIAAVSSGTTPSRSEPAFWNGTIPWITTGEINYKDLWDSEEKVTPVALQKTALRLFPKNGLIMAMYGEGVTRGRVARLKIDATTNQACAYIKPTERADCDFMYQFFCHNYQNLREMGHGGNQKNLSGQLIKQFPVLLPPLPEQRRIAAILSQWDDSLSILNKLIEAKRQQKRGLAEQLLTGKRRLKGFEGEWEELDLQELASIDAKSLGSNTDPNYEFWYLSLTEISNGQILFPSKKEVFSKAPSRARRIVKKDDVLMATVRPNLQSFAYVALDQPDLIASTGFAVITARQHAEPKFLYYYLYSEHLTSQIEKLTTGSNYPAISSGEVKKLRINAPPLVEQQAIASILSTLDDEIATLNALKAKVQEQKRGLMDLLLTGRVRVKVQEA